MAKTDPTDMPDFDRVMRGLVGVDPDDVKIAPTCPKCGKECMKMDRGGKFVWICFTGQDECPVDVVSEDGEIVS